MHERPRRCRRGLPLRLGEDEAGVSELRHCRRVVEVHVRHHDRLDVLRVQTARAQLRRDVLARFQVGLREPGDDAAEVRGRLRRHRRVEAGVDQERPRRWVVDQERGHGDRPPARARRADAQHPKRRNAARALEKRRRNLEPTGVQRLDGNGRSRRAALQRAGQIAGCCLHLHRLRRVEPQSPCGLCSRPDGRGLPNLP